MHALGAVGPEFGAGNTHAAFVADVVHRKSRNSLNLTADFHAAVTTDALVGIAHQAIGRPVQWSLFGKAAVAAVVLQAHVERQVL